MEACIREIREETHISPHQLICVDEQPIDIDLHYIPRNGPKKESKHWHCDFQFVFRLQTTTNIILQKEEVLSFKWLSLSKMPMQKIADQLRSII